MINVLFPLPPPPPHPPKHTISRMIYIYLQGILTLLDLHTKYVSIQVLDRPIRLLHVDDDVVVVNKPSSIPVHPVGRFRVSFATRMAT